MDTTHNPDRYISNLRQILSQGQKRIGLLVGAGAPLSIRLDNHDNEDPTGRPLIPGVDELTALTLSGISDDSLRTAVNALNIELGSKNIETILSMTRLRSSALGSAQVHGLDGNGYKELGTVICARIAEIVNQPLPTFITPYSHIVSWIRGTNRLFPVEIFTTNYDLLFESAFERVRAPYFDGFTGGATPFFDPTSVSSGDLPSRWTRLWKLHGSLGWTLHDNSIVRGANKGEAQLIYPDHLKYDLTQKQPYTALFDRLKDFLRTPDTLLMAIGFSFRDAHVSSVIEDALAENKNASIFAFQFNTLDQERPVCDLAYALPNLSVYASDGAVINGVRGPWRPGELPKNWEAIRDTFWVPQTSGGKPAFSLGDFVAFARFCAFAQATDFETQPKLESTSNGPDNATVPA